MSENMKWLVKHVNYVGIKVCKQIEKSQVLWKQNKEKIGNNYASVM
jgi:hypothetical protein